LEQLEQALLNGRNAMLEVLQTGGNSCNDERLRTIARFHAVQDHVPDRLDDGLVVGGELVVDFHNDIPDAMLDGRIEVDEGESVNDLDVIFIVVGGFQIETDLEVREEGIIDTDEDFQSLAGRIYLSDGVYLSFHSFGGHEFDKFFQKTCEIRHEICGKCRKGQKYCLLTSSVWRIEDFQP
jgi:hypothetical protein